MTPESMETSGARFSVSVDTRAATATLHSRRPLSSTLGRVESLELVAADLPARVDLRHGAIAFRDRRTRVRAAAIRVEPTTLVLGAARLGALVSIAPSRDRVRASTLSLWDDTGALAMEVSGTIEDGALILRAGPPRSSSEGDASVRARAIAQGVVAGFAGRAAWAPSAQGGVTLTIPGVVERLIAAALVPLGWRPSDARGLNGHITFEASGPGVLPAPILHVTRGAAAAELEPTETAVAPPPVPGDNADEASFVAFMHSEPSAWLRADVALRWAESGRGAPEALAMRALSLAGSLPQVVTRALDLAAWHANDAIVEAALAGPLPSTQKAELALDGAIGAAQRGDATRAARWIALARPLAGDVATLRRAEAELSEAEEDPPATRAIVHERAAAACLAVNEVRLAADHLARSAEAHDEANAIESADDMWLVLVALPKHHPTPTTRVRAARAVHRRGGPGAGSRATEILAPLLSLHPGSEEAAKTALDAALTAAATLHRDFGNAGAAALFDARRDAL